MTIYVCMYIYLFIIIIVFILIVDRIVNIESLTTDYGGLAHYPLDYQGTRVCIYCYENV